MDVDVSVGLSREKPGTARVIEVDVRRDDVLQLVTSDPEFVERAENVLAVGPDPGIEYRRSVGVVDVYGPVLRPIVHARIDVIAIRNRLDRVDVTDSHTGGSAVRY